MIIFFEHGRSSQELQIAEFLFNIPWAEEITGNIPVYNTPIYKNTTYNNRYVRDLQAQEVMSPADMMI